jgi:hypothetical protein
MGLSDKGGRGWGLFDDGVEGGERRAFLRELIICVLRSKTCHLVRIEMSKVAASKGGDQ